MNAFDELEKDSDSNQTCVDCGRSMGHTEYCQPPYIEESRVSDLSECDYCVKGLTDKYQRPCYCE